MKYKNNLSDSNIEYYSSCCFVCQMKERMTSDTTSSLDKMESSMKEEVGALLDNILKAKTSCL